MHLEARPVAVHVVEVEVGGVARPPLIELGLDRLADAARGRLRQRGLRTERLGEGRLDVTYGQAPNEAGDHERLERVGAGDALAEQPRRERLVGAARLGPLGDHRAGGGLDRDRLIAVAVPFPGPLPAGVAVAAQELDTDVASFRVGRLCLEATSAVFSAQVFTPVLGRHR